MAVEKTTNLLDPAGVGKNRGRSTSPRSTQGELKSRKAKTPGNESAKPKETLTRAQEIAFKRGKSTYVEESKGGYYRIRDLREELHYYIQEKQYFVISQAAEATAVTLSSSTETTTVTVYGWNILKQQTNLFHVTPAQIAMAQEVARIELQRQLIAAEETKHAIHQAELNAQEVQRQEVQRSETKRQIQSAELSGQEIRGMEQRRQSVQSPTRTPQSEKPTIRHAVFVEHQRIEETRFRNNVEVRHTNDQRANTIPILIPHLRPRPEDRN